MMQRKLEGIFKKLYKQYGSQHWWPGETAFEVAIGAILTQNTNWENVEKAIHKLRPYLKPEIIHHMENDQLAEYIRPSGYYNVKAKRIKNFLNWFETYHYSFNIVQKKQVEHIREELLQINGIGKETADSIILYALHKPIFVIDAYTRRFFQRLGFNVPEDYDAFRQMFEEHIEKDEQLYNEYHALIVIHSKERCRRKPLCSECIFIDKCNRK